MSAPTTSALAVRESSCQPPPPPTQNTSQICLPIPPAAISRGKTVHSGLTPGNACASSSSDGKRPDLARDQKIGMVRRGWYRGLSNISHSLSLSQSSPFSLLLSKQEANLTWRRGWVRVGWELWVGGRGWVGYKRRCIAPRALASGCNIKHMKEMGFHVGPKH